MSAPTERPRGLAVDPNAPPRQQNSPMTTPKSALIAIPSEWSDNSDGRDKRIIDSEPMSTTSSSSSSHQLFAWPPPQAHSLQNPSPSQLMRERSDPFDQTTSFAEDPFGHRSSSSSSGDDELHRQTFPAVEERRGSIVFIPHQMRSITDPASHDNIPIDPEFSGAGPPIDSYDFDTENGPPRFNRTFSAPLPNRVGFLRHPLSPNSPGAERSSSSHRESPLAARPTGPSHESSSSTTVVSDSPTSPITTLSHELADSLQSAIQTLLHLSPPHLLDNAKEQYSGCTVQMPTTSLSALLTSMRSLNYLSANVETLCDAMASQPEKDLMTTGKVEDFDIGELVQNVADLLGGQAAQAGVDLVLFHGDVSIKHVSVSGDVEGLGYVLSHILRQILAVANKGDIIEIGLQLIPQSPSLTPKLSLPLSAADLTTRRKVHGATLGETLQSTPGSSEQGPVLCIVEIIHNINQTPGSAAVTPRAELNPFARLAEEKEAITPKLDTILCRRLLHQQRALLKQDVQPSSPPGSGMPRRAYELSVLLPRGKPLVEPAPLSAEEEAIRQPFATVKLAREPTLAELSDFAESLRGKKVFLHASLSSLFARHLTSYLAAWGLDISHIPIEDDHDEKPGQRGAIGNLYDSGYLGSSSSDIAAGIQSLSLSAPIVPALTRDTDRFIIIDDDISILRREMLRMRAEAGSFTLKPRLMKRPTLAGRARSTPHVRQISTPSRASAPVLIHFTSLANFNQVRDVVSSVFGPPSMTSDGAYGHPEVMVIPKPVGPRRFLTALHTAVNQPMVDPFFSPIATTPRSPGGGYFHGVRTPLGSDGLKEGFFDSVPEEPDLSPSGSQKARSPMVEHPLAARDGNNVPITTPAEVIATPASEYFSNVAKVASGASGTVIQSPDGRFGIQFDPPVKGERRSSYSQRGPPDSLRRKPSSRRASGQTAEAVLASASPPPTQTSRRQSTISEASVGSAGSNTPARRASLRNSESPIDARRSRTLPPQPDEPVVYPGRQRSSTVTRRQPASPVPTPALTPVVSSKEVPRKKAKEESVMPPINVLIVEDNPINQNILSMFLRKKKIKHQTAKDGLEAVEKWRTGEFHLILMDIQLPVMDGIEATKEIRRLEINNNIGVFPSTPGGELNRSLETTAIPASPFRQSVIIVALTASSLNSDRVVALAAGCNDFLTKPVSLKWLEQKITEWGCMQALIDFDGWRRWKSVDTNETKRGFSLGPQKAARGVADRLRIERKSTRSPSRPPQPDITVHAATPPLEPPNGASSASPLDAPRSISVDDKPIAATSAPSTASDAIGVAAEVIPLTAIIEDSESPAVAVKTLDQP